MGAMLIQWKKEIMGNGAAGIRLALPVACEAAGAGCPPVMTMVLLAMVNFYVN